MAKKRNINKKFSSFRSKKGTKPTAQQLHAENAELLLVRILYHSHGPLTLPEIFTKKAVKKFDKKLIKAALNKLVKDGVLKKTGKDIFSIHPAAPLYKGKLSQNIKGFGFVIPNGIHHKTPGLDIDLFVPQSKMAGAMHGDTLLVICSFTKKGKRSEGSIVDILEKRTNQLCGVVSLRGHEIFVHPDDARFPFKVLLKERKDLPLQNGDAVIVEYKRPTKPTRTLSGKLLKILGDSGEIDTQMEMVISSHDLPHLLK